ncbi:hypothetical protein CR513_27007, partial [Mucuna pruriens]
MAREIQDVVELQHYGTLGELVCQVIKVEMQIKRSIEERMGDNNDDLESYLPKTRKVMRHIKRLEEKFEKLGGGLESMRIDTRRHIATWMDLRRELKTRFVPTTYARDTYNKP